MIAKIRPAAGALLAVTPLLCNAGALVLKNAFIEKYKNCATIDATFSIDHVLPRPHEISSGGDDGDLHMSGRGDTIGLPVVAEIVNAREPAQSVTTRDAESDDGKTVRISGAWRVWFEHPPANGESQIQGNTVQPATNPNPAHMFEIHPVSAFNGVSILKSFDQIPKYRPYDAATAFNEYERLTANITANATSTAIDSARAVHNYAEFIIELGGSPASSDDGGLLALAEVFKDDETTVTSGLRRMVFVGGTAAAEKVKPATKGARFHVLGIPRVNLERVSFAAKQHPGQAFKAPLPYEMIIVAILP
jgi:hypothetical protein